MKISINNASKIIHGKAVLSDICLELSGGHIYGLCGYNGSGKTMLMRLIAGLIRPTMGTVTLDGKDLGRDIDFPPSLGLLIENPAFLPMHTGYRNIQLLTHIKGLVPDSEILQTLREVGLEPHDSRKYRKYSLGMKQRLGIAAALVEKPDLLLLDEPFNALDSEGIVQVTSLIQQERARGALIIMACHDKTALESLSDTIFKMENGRILGVEI